MGTNSNDNNNSVGWNRAGGLIMKTLVLVGGALLLKRLTKSTTRWDHARFVSQSLSGEKNDYVPCSRNGGWFHGVILRTSFLQNSSETLSPGIVIISPSSLRFYTVKPCSKEMKCDVELSSYAIREMEEYKNFCDRTKDQRPLPEEIVGDIAEHLTTLHLKRCDRGKRCLYEGSTPPGGFPNSWNGASYCTSEIAILKNNEVHTWERGYDEDGNQVWGTKEGPYEFKPVPASSLKDMFSPLNFSQPSMEKRILEGSFVLQ
ncbi:chromophore lyase CRL [Cucumis melo var. makuwa]|uniref:Chromophore lyase CRL n=1 Tax=Cucumis melo var. makuwa TaxID=1194695 RepID=A0A5A7UK19_CUCMM|nr:chromophore lyase CRL [Cucumis melo var. makuwa]